MSADNKFGKIIITGFNGTSSANAQVQKIKQHIDNYSIGGIILYQRNIINQSQLKSLINYLTQDTPAIITIDHEGGYVNRLVDPSFELETPSAESFYKLPIHMQKKIANKTAQKLKELGITVNFGGVADIKPYIQPSSVCQSNRCFSDNTEKIVDCLNQHLIAHDNHNLVYTIKHFPGISFTPSDSHHSLPDITKSHSQVDYMPYHTLNQTRFLKMVMVGHSLNKNIDPNYPSSLSKKTIDYLKTIIGFDGIHNY